MATDTKKASDKQEIFVFCKTCQQNIGILVDEAQIKSSEAGVTSVVSMHGEPSHAIMVYLDRNLDVRAIEYPYAIVTDDAVTEATDEEVERAREEDIDLIPLVELFGMGKKKNIQVMSNLLMQILLSNPVYLVHQVTSLTDKLVDGIANLFTNQKISLKGIPPPEVSTIKDRQPFIFNLQEQKYIYEGVKVDTRFLESLVKESHEDDKGSFKLRNELSKIFYAYERMKELIRSATQKLQETQLSKDIGIELKLMPHLLKMAESQEIDVKEKVESDGFARALRSI